MTPADLLTDALDRVRESVASVLDGASDDLLVQRPGPDANSIAWLVWHLTRVEDDHISDIAGRPQTWSTGGWNTRFGTDPSDDNLGYGHTPEQVAHFGRQARHYAFMGSQGSDFHAPGESYVDLGGGLPLPEGVVPIWNNW